MHRVCSGIPRNPLLQGKESTHVPGKQSESKPECLSPSMEKGNDFSWSSFSTVQTFNQKKKMERRGTGKVNGGNNLNNFFN